MPWRQRGAAAQAQQRTSPYPNRRGVLALLYCAAANASLPLRHSSFALPVPPPPFPLLLPELEFPSPPEASTLSRNPAPAVPYPSLLTCTGGAGRKTCCAPRDDARLLQESSRNAQTVHTQEFSEKAQNDELDADITGHGVCSIRCACTAYAVPPFRPTFYALSRSCACQAGHALRCALA